MENVKQNNSFIKDSSYILNSSNKASKKNSTSLIKSSSTRNLGNKHCIDIFKPDTSFEHSLRNYKNPPTRVFRNYSKPRGNYFDPKYQYGGESILIKNTKNNRSKTLSMNDSKDSIIKNTNHSIKN